MSTHIGLKERALHDLQQRFASEAGEAAWTADMHALFAAGSLDTAEALLAEALTALDSELAWECLEHPREAVALTGWDALAEAIAVHEGDAITGITIAIANDADRAFEKGAAHRPHVLLGLYTDEAYAFSRAAPGALLDACRSAEPGWAGWEEDVEVHMGIEGLDTLNTSLLHHKQRHFFRDGQTAPAPLRYVEFVLGCWWRALRWHQAVATQCAVHGLPGGPPVIAGMVDMRPEAAAIHASARAAPRPVLTVVGGRDMAAPMGCLGESFIQRKPAEPEPVAPPSVTTLRRRMQQESAPVSQPRRAGLLARLFGRR